MMQGGEIFVPKIPSMKIVDLARAMAPEKPLRFIGIRPGEKLHEVMITQDDARNTVELEDRYVIMPAFLSRDDASLLPTGKPVVERFSYASDTNAEWLTDKDFLEWVRESGEAQADMTTAALGRLRGIV
jgi:UDP-N-acetylglucosamine 4,6-dehydratase